MAGKQAGLSGGKRSALWWEFHRIARVTRPEWLLIENVPNFLSINRGRDFGIFLDSLEELGYTGISWSVLDAKGFGVPQTRRRLFVVATTGAGRPEEVLALGEGSVGDPPEGTRQGTDPAEVGPRRFDGGTDRYAQTLGARDYKGAGSWRNGSIQAYQLVNGLFRRLTVNEREKLMGWPVDWTRWGIDDQGKKYEIPEKQRIIQTGNGVVALVAEWIGRRLMAEDLRTKSDGIYKPPVLSTPF